MCAVYQNPAGWTVVDPAADTRISYCDPAGDDGTATPYDWDDPAVGADPYNPVGPINAYQTPASAVAAARDGMADWVLFKKGETWTVRIGGLKSGRSTQEPLLISSYGTGALPAFVTNDGNHFIEGGGWSFIALLGLDFKNTLMTAEPHGWRTVSNTSSILIEGCRISQWNMGIDVTSTGNSDVTIRRNWIFDCYSVTTHSQGVYVEQTDGLVIEENTFDHNGYENDLVTPTDGRSHNVYITAGIKNVKFNNNLTIRPAMKGLKFQAKDSVCEVNGNVASHCPEGFQIGGGQWPTQTPEGMILTVNDNIVVDWVANTNAGIITYGISFTNIQSGSAARNIVSLGANLQSVNFRGMYFDDPEGSNPPGLWGFGVDNFNVSNCVVFDWIGGFGVGNKGNLGYRNSKFIDCKAVYLTAVGRVDSRNPTLSGDNDNSGGVEWQNGTYFSLNYPGTPFWYASGYRTYAQWKANRDATAENVDPAYPDPTRNIPRYQAEVRGKSLSIEEFAADCRLQSRDNWDESLTALAIQPWISAGFGSAVLKPASPTNLQVTVV